jgi:exodeoxyribonuclease VII large subunit
MSKIFMNDPLMPENNNRLLAGVDAGDNAQPFSVSELSNSLKRTVEERFGHVRVRGELSGFKRATSGHLYFGLKDENARLDGVMWKGVAGRLPFAPEDGLEVVVTGKLTTYAGRSSYQIIAEGMELAGEGALMLLFEKLKARLGEEGLFSAERKRAIPHIPRVIGVVTSPTGAVIRDILHRLNARYPSHVIIWPVLVQGENAAAQISAAINGFSALPESGSIVRPDLIIVARGGGSIEDLWAFNEEAVVRAVAACTIPLISAVGHETDTTLCDYAADLRAPTPTAAAEMAVPVRSELLDRVAQNAMRLGRAARRSLTHAAERLEAQRRLLPKLSELTAPQQQRADELGERLTRGLERRIGLSSLAFAAPAGALNERLLLRLTGTKEQRLLGARLSVASLNRRLENHQTRLDTIARLMVSLHPEAPLKRGFARVTDALGKTISNITAAQMAGQVTLRFADGELGASIDDHAPSERVMPKPKPRPKPNPRPKSADAAKARPGQGNLFGE